VPSRTSRPATKTSSKFITKKGTETVYVYGHGHVYAHVDVDVSVIVDVTVTVIDLLALLTSTPSNANFPHVKILALDTSCDESCAAIIDTEGPRLLADVVHSHVAAMKQHGGIVPEIASREHLKALPLAVNQALEKAGMKANELDWISVTNKPGLIGALLVGVSYAKALAYALKKPFSAVDHIEGHLFSPLLAELEGKPAPAFPWIALVVSGGHTELFHVLSTFQYKRIGGTRDDAAGEAFDKIGKLLGLPYPAGPLIDKLARGADTKKYKFPRAILEEFDFSFSGLKTAVNLQVKALGAIDDSMRPDLAASAQEAILEPLVRKIAEAQNRLGVKQVVVSGGVACNSRLRELLPGAYFPSPRHCSDNAAMIGLITRLRLASEHLIADPWTTTAFPN